MAAAVVSQPPAMIRHIEQGLTMFSAAELHVVSPLMFVSQMQAPRAALVNDMLTQAVVPIGKVPPEILLPYYSLITRHRQVSPPEKQ